MRSPALLIDQHQSNNDHHHYHSSAANTAENTGAGVESDVTSNPKNISQKNNSRHRPIQRPNSRLSSASTTATDLRKRPSVNTTGGGSGRSNVKPPSLPQSESLANYPKKPIITITSTPPIAAKDYTRTITSPRPDDKNNSNNHSSSSSATNPTSPNKVTTKPAGIASQPTTSSLASKTRSPLKAQTQNASHMKKKPLEIGLFKIGVGRGTPSPRANMPPERSLSTNTNNGNRPQMPSLSASAARAANKTPLMPKLASKAQPPTLATTTPTARRTQRPPATASQPTQHEELSASMPPFLANVTPRSGSRQNRVDSANTTPNGTPHAERFEERDLKFGPGPVSPPPPRPDHARRSGSSFAPLQFEPNGPGGREAQHASESKFFHASEAHNARPAATTKQPAQTKQATFFYANRTAVENKANNANPNAVHSMPTATQSQDNVSSKFMYANGKPEVQSSSLSVPLSRSTGPAASSTPKPPTTGRLSVGSQASAMHHGPRPVSPTKAPSQSAQPSLMSSAIPPSTAPQRGQPSHLPGSAADKLRRTSSGTSRTRGPHSRSGSLVLTDIGASASAPSSKLMSPLYPSSPVHTPSTPTPLTLASIIQAAEELPEPDESLSADESRSEIQSPTKSNTTDPMNELVANARRERKVQDLQITNASLEAINRTLERQLRKQTTELRRYKRMSRAGLSLASTAASNNAASEAIFVEEVGLRLANLSEEESDAEDEAEGEQEEESFSDTDEDIESLTPNQLAERDAKHRKRDEQRLKQDLTKHQQLFVDSQKINQSIKRCLDWTEELIKDGKKALAYNVKFSDVKFNDIELGGKILSPSDKPEEQDEPSHLSDKNDDLADDTIKLGNFITEEPERISDWSLGPQDRDSGIEMPVDGG